MSIPSMPIKEYASYKLRRYFEGDKGALGDFVEVVFDTIEYARFDYNHVHVGQLNKADKYSKGGSIEVGHNGKQWNLRKPYDRQRHPRRVVYGVLTLDETIEMVNAVIAGNLATAQAKFYTNFAIFNSEDEYMEIMDGLTRGKGIRVAHTADRGDLVMTIYNPSKHKAFLKALANGTLTRYKGRA